MNYWFLAAAAAAVLTFVVHVFLGGRYVAKPLLKADGLGEVAKYTAYYCWHLVSIVLAGMALAFLRAGLFTGGREVAAASLVFATCAFLWSLMLISRWKLSWIKFPQWMLFALVMILGAGGLWL